MQGVGKPSTEYAPEQMEKKNCPRPEKYCSKTAAAPGTKAHGGDERTKHAEEQKCND